MLKPIRTIERLRRRRLRLTLIVMAGQSGRLSNLVLSIVTMRKDTDKAVKAFAWITEALESRSIPFRVAGGLAARLYGATRPLADIDLDVPEEHLATVAADLKAFIKFGPGRFVDESWDLQLLTLDYHGQEIDLSGAQHGRVFARNRKEWINLSTDFESSPRLEVLGRSALVIPKEELITYKRILGREVDDKDVEQMTRP